MLFQAEKEIKARMKAVGLTARSFAKLLQERPSTVRNRLNGYLPLLFTQRRAIMEKLDREEERKRLKNQLRILRAVMPMMFRPRRRR